MIYLFPLLIQWGFIAYLSYQFYQLKQFKHGPVFWTKEAILTLIFGLPLCLVIGAIFHTDLIATFFFSLGLFMTNELKKYLK